MAVLMAKSERLHKAYSDYKHLSTDNLSFVAGLRGRPIPAPASEPALAKARRPIADVLSEKDEATNSSEAGHNDDSVDSVQSSGARQACSNRACAQRTEKLEAMMEQKIVAQIARHRAQSKLASASERSQEAESKLEEANTELMRMCKSIAEGDDRMEALRDTLRSAGSVNKSLGAEFDMFLKDAVSLRRVFAADTLPPHPAITTLSVESNVFGDGRSIQPPVTAPGQIQATNSGIRDWVHNGQLGHTRVFLRPSTSNVINPPFLCGNAGLGSSTGPQNALMSGVDVEDGRPADVALAAGSTAITSTAAGERANDRSEAEDAWSCCGKTLVCAGRGCEPKEPVATPEDLLLDTIDPRSRVGQPLDFRDFLPRIAWIGLTSDPIHPFAGSQSEGTLRPHTAPERLGPGQQREHYLSPAKSRNRGGGGGFVDRLLNPTPVGGGDAWSRKETTTAHRPDGGGVVPKRHIFLRRSSPTRVRSSTARRATDGQGSRGGVLPGRGGEGTNSTRSAAVAASRWADGSKAVDSSDFWPRTQILGMNGGRLPTEVKQAPNDRPLTAPCGKVGRRRVRTRGSRGLARP